VPGYRIISDNDVTERYKHHYNHNDDDGNRQNNRKDERKNGQGRVRTRKQSKVYQISSVKKQPKKKNVRRKNALWNDKALETKYAMHSLSDNKTSQNFEVDFDDIGRDSIIHSRLQDATDGNSTHDLKVEINNLKMSHPRLRKTSSRRIGGEVAHHQIPTIDNVDETQYGDNEDESDAEVDDDDIYGDPKDNGYSE